MENYGRFRGWVGEDAFKLLKACLRELSSFLRGVFFLPDSPLSARGRFLPLTRRRSFSLQLRCRFSSVAL